MSSLEIPFGKYRPDYAPLTDDVITCTNLLYYDGKYWGVNDLAVYSSAALSDDPLRMWAAEDADGNKETFLGSDLALYRLEAGPAFLDVSKGGGYSVNVGQAWDWTIYGNTMVAVGGDNVAPQKLTDISAGANFADLGGTPPAARTCCLYKDFLFLGYTTTGVTTSPLRLYRSAQGDIEDWSVSSSTGCGYKDLAAWGQSIVCIRPIGDRLAVYCTESVWLVDFVGSPYWFSYEQVHSGPGPMSIGSVVEVDNNTHLFVSSEDVYQITASGTVTSVGAGIRRTVIGAANSDDHRHRIQSVYDPAYKTAFWALPGDNDYCETILACNYAEQAFTTISVSGYCLGPITGVDTTIGGVSGTLADYTGITFGSSYWRVGGAVYAMLNTSKYICRFNGPVMTQTIETGDKDWGQFVTVTNIRPIIGSPDGGCVVTISHRPDQWSAVSTKSGTFSTTTHAANLLCTNRYMRLKMVVTGAHYGISGAIVDYSARGTR